MSPIGKFLDDENSNKKGNKRSKRKEKRISFTIEENDNQASSSESESTEEELVPSFGAGKVLHLKEAIQNPEEFAAWLIRFFGEETIEHIKHAAEQYRKATPEKNEPTDKDLQNQSTGEWLLERLQELIPEEELQNQLSAVNERLKILNKAEKQVNDLYNEKKNLTEQVNSLDAETNNLKDQLLWANKQVNTSFSLKEFIQSAIAPYKEETNLKNIERLLLEMTEQPNKELVPFTQHLLSHFPAVLFAIEESGSDTKKRMEWIDKSLKHLLQSISGLHVLNRRAILDELAEWVSGYIEDYDFISPERTLQIDPEIHDAVGIGAKTLKEGISFAVVRKDTRKTVKYAEIKA